MEGKPPIIVSSLDLERLERLLESESFKRLTGIDVLREELDRAMVVELAEVPPGVITMNSTARFIDDATGATFELTLVYPKAAGSSDKVSLRRWEVYCLGSRSGSQSPGRFPVAASWSFESWTRNLTGSHRDPL